MQSSNFIGRCRDVAPTKRNDEPLVFIDRTNLASQIPKDFQSGTAKDDQSNSIPATISPATTPQEPYPKWA